MKVRVEVVEHLGLDTNLILDVGERSMAHDSIDTGADNRLFVARIPGNRDIEPGQYVELEVDVTDLHFFDTKTGERLLNHELERAEAESPAESL